jgi:hypothetical protein
MRCNEMHGIASKASANVSRAIIITLRLRTFTSVIVPFQMTMASPDDG